MIWQRRVGRHRSNGNSGHSTNGADLERKNREADAALRAAKQNAERVDNVARTLKGIRERDSLAQLFGDALGGAS